MINVNDFHPGITFLYQDDILLVLESVHSKSGRGQAHVKVKVKNLRTKHITNITFTGGDVVFPAIIDKRPATYIYDEADCGVFMDQTSFDEIRINNTRLKWERNFLSAGNEVNLSIYNNTEILGIILPPSVTLEVTEAPPAVKGNTVSNSTKLVTVETGYQLQVPMFINNGAKIVISTEDGKYKERA